MAYYLAVANRKGGVGKSTVAVMLAHSLSAWAGKRVLVMDLDAQCNTSLILMGGEGWRNAKNAGTTIADFFLELFDGSNPKPRDYLSHGVGDISTDAGAVPQLSILPGSLLLEDVQGELFFLQSRQGRDPDIISNQVRTRMANLLRRFETNFDVVILDCPPGLSFAALAAIRIAHKVIVPFRPDYVSQFAVDRISMLIEDKRRMDDVLAIPLAERRYTTLANCVRPTGLDRLMVEELSAVHPLMRTQLPLKTAISEAFYWKGTRLRLGDKYGDGIGDLRALHNEVSELMAERLAA